MCMARIKSGSSCFLVCEAGKEFSEVRAQMTCRGGLWLGKGGIPAAGEAAGAAVEMLTKGEISGVFFSVLPCNFMHCSRS